MNICPRCETIFQSDSKFQSHRSECNGEWPPGKDNKEQDGKKERNQHKCEHCGENFENQAKLDTHVVMCPEDDTEYECDDCGKVLPTKRHYENHINNCDRRKRLRIRKIKDRPAVPPQSGKMSKMMGEVNGKQVKTPSQTRKDSKTLAYIGEGVEIDIELTIRSKSYL